MARRLVQRGQPFPNNSVISTNFQQTLQPLFHPGHRQTDSQVSSQKKSAINRTLPRRKSRHWRITKYPPPSFPRITPLHFAGEVNRYTPILPRHLRRAIISGRLARTIAKKCTIHLAPWQNRSPVANGTPIISFRNVTVPPSPGPSPRWLIYSTASPPGRYSPLGLPLTRSDAIASSLLLVHRLRRQSATTMTPRDHSRPA